MTSRYASRQPNKLCDNCQAVFPTDGPWFWDREDTWRMSTGGWHLRDFTVHDLDGSAEAGCHLCRVFLDSLLPRDMIVGNRHGYQPWYDSNKENQLRCTARNLRDKTKMQIPGFILELSLAHGGIYSDSVHRSLRFQPTYLQITEKDSHSTTWVTNPGPTRGGPSLPGTAFTIVQPQSTSSFSASSFAQARNWLTECLDCHDECSNWKSELGEKYDYQRKIRFVDVGTEELPEFRLVDGESLANMTGGIKYITLSYRWTAETEVTSMKSYNKASYHVSIPTDNLPQVYNDAAMVARALSIRYVWIDSLCIIQNSLEDWNEQSSLMDQVYTYGILNISAMFADRAFGLQVERDPLAVSPCILSHHLPPKPANGAELYEYWVCFEEYGINSFVDLAPLFKRAWCHQERLLPIRTLYFGEQLIWQCQKTMANESFTSYICRGSCDDWDGMSEHAQRQYNSFGKLSLATSLTALEKLDEKCEEQDVRLKRLAHTWEELVVLYSMANVTEQTDKLVALRGIFNRMAGSFKELEPDWCIAGLWKRCLAKQLLWKRAGEIDESDFQLTARAKEAFELFPSWSWASCATWITYDVTSSWKEYVKTEDMIQVESIQANQPLGPEATYTAFETSSRIILRGLVDAKFNSEELTRDWANDNLVRLRLSISYDGKRTSKDDTWFIFDRPMPQPIKHQDLRLLPARVWVPSPDDHPINKRLDGFLLESLGWREGLPTYRRMGIFTQDYGGDSISGWLGRPFEYELAGDMNMDEIMEEVREKRKEWPLLQLV